MGDVRADVLTFGFGVGRQTCESVIVDWRRSLDVFFRIVKGVIVVVCGAGKGTMTGAADELVTNVIIPEDIACTAVAAADQQSTPAAAGAVIQVLGNIRSPGGQIEAGHPGQILVDDLTVLRIDHRARPIVHNPFDRGIPFPAKHEFAVLVVGGEGLRFRTMAFAAIGHGVAMFDVVPLGRRFVGWRRVTDTALRPGRGGFNCQGEGERRHIGCRRFIVQRLDGEEVVAIGEAEGLVALAVAAEVGIRLGDELLRGRDRIELDIAVDDRCRPADVIGSDATVVAAVVAR